MARRSTIVWRAGVIGLFAGVIPIAIYSYDQFNDVDTESMLDVSVSIKTISHVRIDKVGDSVWESGSGSGFLVSAADCEVWTNHHVIEDAAVIEVFPRGWKRATGIPAKVVNSTPRSDVAILHMEHCEGIPEAQLGDSSVMHPGDETYAVGNPLGRNPDSISRGIISHTERFTNGTTPYLQTDAAINPGNSGGALFNRKGEVIGINTAIASSQEGLNVGIGYAVPINLVKQVAEQLHTGPPSWGDAGIDKIVASLSPDEAEIFNVPKGHAAMIVTKPPSEGPSVGKLEVHDVIYKVNDLPVTSTQEALRTIARHREGDVVSFAIIRDGKPENVAVTLAQGWKRDEKQVPEYYDGHLGMSLEMWTEGDEDRGTYEHPVITKVQSLGPAHRAHVASSQRGIGFRGPFMVSFQLDVKTITGVVFNGKYHPVGGLEDVQRLAADAFASSSPLLLEIQVWARENPMNLDAPLEHMDTSFYKLKPALTTAAKPGDAPADDTVAEAGSEAGSEKTPSEEPQPRPTERHVLHDVHPPSTF